MNVEVKWHIPRSDVLARVPDGAGSGVGHFDGGVGYGR